MFSFELHEEGDSGMQHEERGLRLRRPAGQRERASWVHNSGVAARLRVRVRLGGCLAGIRRGAAENITSRRRARPRRSRCACGGRFEDADLREDPDG